MSTTAVTIRSVPRDVEEESNPHSIGHSVDEVVAEIEAQSRTLKTVLSIAEEMRTPIKGGRSETTTFAVTTDVTQDGQDENNSKHVTQTPKQGVCELRKVAWGHCIDTLTGISVVWRYVELLEDCWRNLEMGNDTSMRRIHVAWPVLSLETCSGHGFGHPGTNLGVRIGSHKSGIDLGVRIRSLGWVRKVKFDHFEGLGGSFWLFWEGNLAWERVMTQICRTLAMVWLELASWMGWGWSWEGENDRFWVMGRSKWSKSCQIMVRGCQNLSKLIKKGCHLGEGKYRLVAFRRKVVIRLSEACQNLMKAMKIEEDLCEDTEYHVWHPQFDRLGGSWEVPGRGRKWVKWSIHGRSNLHQFSWKMESRF